MHEDRYSVAFPCEVSQLWDHIRYCCRPACHLKRPVSSDLSEHPANHLLLLRLAPLQSLGPLHRSTERFPHPGLGADPAGDTCCHQEHALVLWRAHTGHIVSFYSSSFMHVKANIVIVIPKLKKHLFTK